MTAKVWIIEPRDPFIARDGKPFGVGVSAATLPFPYPSTTTGGVRTRAGLANDSFVDNAGNPNQALITKVKEIVTRGALLVELNDGGEITTWFAPAPRDALLVEEKVGRNRAQIRMLLPLNIGKGVTNLSEGAHATDAIVPVGLRQPVLNKPYDRAPRFWRWDEFKQWLLNPAAMSGAIEIEALGHNGPVMETRTHVAIDPQTWTAVEGQLFQTRGLEFTDCEERRLDTAKRLALAVCVEDTPLAQRISEGLAPLGGERRIVAWRESNRSLPACPQELIDAILQQQTKACRVLLLTPAYFAQGFRPSWLLSTVANVKVELAAIASGRAQVISGWDFEKRVPKPTRRLAPAGAVFFLRLEGNDADIVTWIKRIWMQSVSDDAPVGDKEQYRRDGFGLAAIGVWDGQLQEVDSPVGRESE